MLVPPLASTPGAHLSQSRKSSRHAAWFQPPEVLAPFSWSRGVWMAVVPLSAWLQHPTCLPLSRPFSMSRWRSLCHSTLPQDMLATTMGAQHRPRAEVAVVLGHSPHAGVGSCHHDATARLTVQRVRSVGAAEGERSTDRKCSMEWGNLLAKAKGDGDSIYST